MNLELDTLLEISYTDIKNADGQHDIKSTVAGVRTSFNRFLKAPTRSKNICIMFNPDSHRISQIFVAYAQKA